MNAIALMFVMWMAQSPVQLDVQVACTPEGVVELSDPVSIAWPWATFSARDAEKIGATRFRLVDDPAPREVEPAAFPCGVCLVGRYYGPPGHTKFCYAAPEGPMCLRCGKPCPSDPVPIAMVGS